MNELMTFKTISEQTGLDVPSLRKLVEKTDLPAYRIGSSWRFDEKQVLGWLEGNAGVILDTLGKNSLKCISKLKLTVPEKYREKKERLAGEGKLTQVNAFIKSLEIFDGFDSRAITRFIREVKYTRRTYDVQTLLVEENEVVEHVYIVEKGFVYIDLKKNEKERARTFYKKGSVFGLDIVFTIRKHSYTEAYAEEGTSLLIMDYNDILRFLNLHKDFALRFNQNLLRLLSDDSIRRFKHARLLMEKSLRGRIHKYLIQEAIKVGYDSFQLNGGRAGMAEHLGINRSTLSTELSHMKRDGLIDYNGSMFRVLKSFR